MNKQTIVVSFSGGRTSAFMARWLQLNKSHEFNLKYIFANTGSEHENTLLFIDQCARYWDMDIVWVEALVHERGHGTRYREVTFSTASRKNEPFESVIEKYGIPNQAYPHCTRELKLAPINAWVKANSLDDRLMAVGIRADEIDRIAGDYKENAIIYPLITMLPTTRDDVNLWWSRQSFDLNVPVHRGNCVFCWKKMFRKICTNILDDPSGFDWYERMEVEHGLSGHNIDGNPRGFFRQHTKAVDLRIMANSRDFVRYTDDATLQPDLFWDTGGGACGGEECQPFI